MSRHHFFRRLRTWLIAGLVVWLPLAITYFVLDLAVGLMDRTLVLIPPAYRPENLLGFRIPGLGILLTFAVLLVTGVLAANLVGRRLVQLGESILKRIPFVRSVYTAAKNFAEVLLGDTGQSFKKVLLIEYPRKGLYVLAFQTSSHLEEIQYRTDADVVCVFVPTTPNPTSGFIVMVPRDELIELDMSVDEALKMIVSLGIVVPSWQRLDDVPALAKVRPPA
ncbi:MAG: DUF502 domain-containing protein [Chromatiales bacterium]|nr:DUF502 domain-containing protein [Chromatiales bacterium]